MSNEAAARVVDRRGAKRHRITLDIHWQGRHGRAKGTICDLNKEACFVLAGGEVSDGETVHVFIPIGEGMKAQLTGVVTNHEEDIGFAVRFAELGQAQQDVLDNLIRNGADA